MFLNIFFFNYLLLNGLCTCSGTHINNTSLVVLLTLWILFVFNIYVFHVIDWCLSNIGVNWFIQFVCGSCLISYVYWNWWWTGCPGVFFSIFFLTTCHFWGWFSDFSSNFQGLIFSLLIVWWFIDYWKELVAVFSLFFLKEWCD